MKLTTSFTIAVLLFLAVVGPSSAQDDKFDKFVYADFEKAENGRAVSNNGGLVQVYTAQDSTPVQRPRQRCTRRSGAGRAKDRARQPSCKF
jgi:hypothetical protein